jgi:4-amino-4-deoxy-L-arabinose transferase-like glycosyltransferase
VKGVASRQTTPISRLRELLARGWPLLVLALAVRVAQVLATRHWVAVDDPADYIRNAVSIAHGHGMAPSLIEQGGPSAVRPPAYPYLLGGVFAVSGDSETAGRIASALLGVVTVALIGLIADMLWTRRVALVAMALAAVYPPFVLVSGTLLSESLALPLMLGTVALLLHFRDGARPGWLGPAVGLLFGLCLLDRPALSALGLALVAGLWGRPWRRLASGRSVVVGLVVAGLTVIPWTIRNAVQFDDFVPISTQSGFLLAGTYNEVSDHDAVSPGAFRPASLAPSLAPIFADRSLDENQLSKKLGKAGRDYAADHPGYVPRVLWWNGLRLLSLSHGLHDGRVAYRFQGIGARYADAATISWYLLALAALGGIALGAARGAPRWFWLTPVLLYLSVIAISGDVRYRLPVEPFAICAGAVALVAAWERLRGRRPEPQPRPMQPQPR